MKYLERRLQESQKYTNYQVKQIIFLFKTISSDISKVLILGIIFRDHFSSYIIALIMLILLRSFSGGIHLNTYLSCLFISAVYFFLSIIILPKITISFTVKIFLITICMILCDRLGPITSKYRPPLSAPKIILCRNITLSVIFLFTILLYIIPQNDYINVGFWVVILHTVQLAIAKVLHLITRKKGGNNSC